MSDTLSQELRGLARQQESKAIDALPSSSIDQITLLIEATRLLDYLTTSGRFDDIERVEQTAETDITVWGWKGAVARLLWKAAPNTGFPLQASTFHTQAFASAVLRSFGRAHLLRIVADRAARGLAVIERVGDQYHVRTGDAGGVHLRDTLDRASNLGFGARVRNERPASWNGWTLYEHDHPEEGAAHSGVFMSQQRFPLECLKSSNIDALMDETVMPWESTAGRMVGYGALPEIDDHYLTLAVQLMTDYRDAIGLHPEADCDGVSGAHLVAVAAAVASLHMKHVDFVRSAIRRGLNPRVVQSLTIWSLADELARGIAEWSGVPLPDVARAIELMSVRPDDADLFGRLPGIRIPLLVDFGNNVLMRPVGSMTQNPLVPVFELLESRRPELAHKIRRKREGQLRDNLYAMFFGSRYVCVPHAVKLRRADGSEVTDIDAAVLDTTTGEMAFFQLKWQDTHTDDIAQLSSRAKNLRKQIESWCDRVDEWMSEQSVGSLMSAFQLSAKRQSPVLAVSLFAITRSLSRTENVGVSVQTERIAVGTIDQLHRLRRELGPIPNVFAHLFRRLQEEASTDLVVEPTRYECDVADRRFVFHDIWWRLPDSSGMEASGD